MGQALGIERAGIRYRELRGGDSPVGGDADAVRAQESPKFALLLLIFVSREDIVVDAEQPRSLTWISEVDRCMVGGRALPSNGASDRPARFVEGVDMRRQFVASEDIVNFAESPSRQQANGKEL